MGILRDFQHRARQSGAPVTVALTVLLIISFLVPWLVQRDVLKDLWFRSIEGQVTAAWTFLTYPFYNPGIGNSFIWFVISLLWLWMVGGSVERDYSSSRFAGIWVIGTLLGAICVWIGCAVLGTAFILAGPLIPVSVVTIIWCVRNPSAQITLMLVLPITGKWLGWITAGIVLFNVGQAKPALGVFALIPLGVAYVFASGGLPALSQGRSGGYRFQDKLPRGRDDKYFDEVKKREKEREERDRLKKLFESSLKDEDDKKS